MSAQIMDGTSVANALLDEVRQRAAEFTAAAGRAPVLATVLVGDDPASRTYVKMKRARSARVGIDSRSVELPASTSTAELLGELAALSADPAVDGILLQHPVPGQIDERAAFEAIAPGKDVDGVTGASFASMALMSKGGNGFQSCTPGGMLRLLDAYDVPISGRRAVVVGRSPILGKPMGLLLLGRDATVTFTHSRTTDLADIVREADIVVAAVGRPELVRGDWIKPGAVVLDAGYNAGNTGDVEFAAAGARAGLITPVPGGVGPMTIAVLLAQTVQAAGTLRLRAN
jgi:methylenetetrahydrofolate dehydrogenase (NADP+) / methenyltetrahydrofolate cyclohydrolase